MKRGNETLSLKKIINKNYEDPLALREDELEDE